MTIPTIRNIDTFAELTQVTDATLTYPEVVAAGDLFICMIATWRSAITFGWPTGDWADNELAQAAGPSTNYRYAFSYLIADGTEAGETFDVSLSVGSEWTAMLFHIKDWHGTTPPEIGTIVEATDNDTGAVSLNPSWDSSADDTLWLWHHIMTNNTSAITTFPTEMPDNNVNYDGTGTEVPQQAYASDDSSTANKTVAAQVNNISLFSSHGEVIFGIRGAIGHVYINDAPELDGGEVEQAYPGAANWADTSIDVQTVPDTTGLSGQLYVIVERADGVTASRAITIQASGPTGTGAANAQDATAAGTGNKASSATGTPTAQDSTAAGAGFVNQSGTGVLAAQDAAASGAGTRIAEVSLVLTAANNRELKDAGGSLVASLSNIVWEWYDTPGSTAGEPIDSGTFNTDASGEATITVTDSALADGEFGQLIIYHPSDPLIRATLRVPVTD